MIALSTVGNKTMAHADATSDSRAKTAAIASFAAQIHHDVIIWYVILTSNT
jgi:hypothetical protein